MQLSERSYGGKFFRPRPEIDVDAQNGLTGICTPWGNRSSAKQALQTLKSTFLAARVDQEVTMPFDRLTCLSSVANDLRISMKITNDSIYNNENKKEFTSGVELCAIAKGPSELTLAQIGGPFAFLKRPGHALTSLSPTMDLPAEFGTNLAPLPSSLLGVETTSNFALHSLRFQSGDQLVFLARAQTPPEFYRINDENLNLDFISKTLVTENLQEPFWLGILTF